jgi:hypothetical protein
MEKQIITELYQRLDDHDKQLNEYGEAFSKLINAQHGSAVAINQLALSMTELTNDTRSIVQLHKDLKGTVRVGSGIQLFILWCMKWGVIGVGVATGISWVVEHFNK